MKPTPEMSSALSELMGYIADNCLIKEGTQPQLELLVAGLMLACICATRPKEMK